MMSLTFGLFTQVSGSGPLGPLVYPVFFVFVFRLFRIRVTVFFASYLLLLIYSSALLKQCSGAIVRFSDSFSYPLAQQSCGGDIGSVPYVCM